MPLAPEHGDLDALAESLRGVYVLQLVVSDAGHRRRYFYKNLDAAQRAVSRAARRGRDAHLSLVAMAPVTVVSGDVLDGGDQHRGDDLHCGGGLR